MTTSRARHTDTPKQQTGQQPHTRPRPHPHIRVRRAVFILTRMREAYDDTGSTRQAIVTGIGRTGRLVTSAALILFLASVSLASNPEVNIKILATGLGAGILVDAVVIRSILVPAFVSLLGHWNWYLPRWPATLLRVRRSHRTHGGTPDEFAPAS